MTDRQRFEAWVSGPPYEYHIDRFPRESSWPGQYRNIAVELAWLAWREGRKAQR